MIDKLFEGFVVGVVVVVMVVALLGVFDLFQSLRSERQVQACRMQQMDSYRLTFADDVQCVPYPNRRDTVVVEGVR